MVSAADEERIDQNTEAEVDNDQNRRNRARKPSKTP
jgi:hypothetical protein